MKVLRKQEKETSNIQVGDQIKIPLTNFGEFTATAHKVTDEGVLFIFDECVSRRPMNKDDTNKGSFEGSDLRKWMDTALFEAFPDLLKGRIFNLSIPTIGEIFGDKDFLLFGCVGADDDEQLQLMKKARNRIACFENYGCSFWLRNKAEYDYISGRGFAYVDGHGLAHYGNASDPNIGVRPEFWLKKESEDVKEPTDEYTKHVEETKKLMDSFVDVGFSEDQPFQRLLADVSRIKDNLNRLFGVTANSTMPKVSYEKWPPQPKTDYDEIVFERLDYALEVLDFMEKIINADKAFRVADMAKLVDVPANIFVANDFEAYRYGWTDINKFRIEQTRYGCILKVPKASRLIKKEGGQL